MLVEYLAMNADDSALPKRTEDKRQTIVTRLERIEDSLVREAWLPIGLRGRIATELPQLSRLARLKSRIGRSKLSKQVLALALASWMYGPSPLESETVSQLRILDLELNADESFDRQSDPE